MTSSPFPTRPERIDIACCRWQRKDARFRGLSCFGRGPGPIPRRRRREAIGGCGYQGNWGYPRRVKALSPGVSVTLFGGLAADGRSAALLVTDYRGKSTALDLDVRGLDGWRMESVRVLDDTHDLVADKALAASFANGRLKLAKSEPGSAVFLVRFCVSAEK